MNIKIPPAESQLIEFKQEWTDNVKKTFCAFLNTHGGTVYFGLNDDGKVVGIEKPDELERKIHSIFKFSIHPSAERNVQTETHLVRNKKIVVVTILEGDDPPYYVTIQEGKNQKERRCFIRQGSSSYEATDKEVRDLYIKGNPIPFEQRACRNQDLTFRTLKEFFTKADLPFDEKKYQTLGLRDTKGFFSNTAFWLSDQCTAETRVGFFLGDSKASQNDGIYTFSGCIVKQFCEIRELLQNRFGFTHKIDPFVLRSDGTRNEVTDYPERAVREALINLFAHRDYALENAQATVTSFSDRLEFLSFGGLPRGVNKEMMLQGVSIPRNRILADVLMRLSAMEKYGIGIPIIFDSYKDLPIKPDLVCDHEYIKVILPKVRIIPGDLNERNKKLVEFLNKKGPSGRKQIQDFLGVSYGTALSTLNALEDRGIIFRQGRGPSTKYYLKAKVN